jgi:hypothetical protein
LNVENPGAELIFLLKALVKREALHIILNLLACNLAILNVSIRAVGIIRKLRYPHGSMNLERVVPTTGMPSTAQAIVLIVTCHVNDTEVAEMCHTLRATPASFNDGNLDL